jgi:hypothetical protein
MNLPSPRHLRHAELDELIAATNERRAPRDVAAQAQRYTNIDDEYDDALARVAARQLPTRCPRCGTVGNGACCLR